MVDAMKFWIRILLVACPFKMPKIIRNMYHL